MGQVFLEDEAHAGNFSGRGERWCCRQRSRHAERCLTSPSILSRRKAWRAAVRLTPSSAGGVAVDEVRLQHVFTIVMRSTNTS